MHIAVIGATGKAGSRIANEVFQRGHEVTAIQRRPDGVDTDRYGLLVKDLFDLTEADLEDMDVVVDAFNSPPGKEYLHKASVLKLIEVMENLPDVRLLIVGGAASLFTDATRTKRVLSTIPAEFSAVPASMLEGFLALETSKVNWTFMSPAFFFDADGPRTGRYTLGTDYLIQNRRGQSYVSFADFAVAMADEIEKPNFIGKRFTVVSEPGTETDPEEVGITEGRVTRHRPGE